MQTDWTSFTQRITVDAPVRTIYDAWCKPGNLTKWFLSNADFTAADKTVRKTDSRIKAGDTYCWRWYGYPDSIYETGTVLEANGHDVLRFTFTDNSEVNVNIGLVGGERIVELTQNKIAADEDLKIYLGCSSGWVFYLSNLKSILEGGIDLRNRNARIKNVLNA